MLHYKVTRNSRGSYSIITSPWSRVLAGVPFKPPLLMALSIDEEYGPGKA